MLRLVSGASFLLLLLQLLQTLLVGGCLLARVLKGCLHRTRVRTLMAKTEMSHQTLDLRSLVSLVSVVLELTTHHELADIVLRRQTEQLADLRSPLRTQTTRLRRGFVSQAGDVLLALLHYHQVQHTDIGTNDAPTHRLSLALTLLLTHTPHTHITTSSVARHTVRQEKTHTVVAKNTLHHGETLLVVSSSNAENHNHSKNTHRNTYPLNSSPRMSPSTS